MLRNTHARPVPRGLMQTESRVYQPGISRFSKSRGPFASVRDARFGRKLELGLLSRLVCVVD